MAISTSGGRVVIAGAGPVGLVTALLLCRNGIPVTILEAGRTVCQETRASYYHAPTLDMLDDIGFLRPLLRGGQIERSPRMVDVGLGREVRLEFDVLRSRYRHPYSLCAGQSWFCSVGYELLDGQDCDIRFGHCVTEVRQEDDGVEIIAETAEGPVTIHTDWLIGCDGASSAVRKSQGIAMEGYTWPDRFILIELKQDFSADFGTLSFLLDGPDWRLVTKISYGPGPDDWIYRFVAGVQPHENDTQVLDPDNLQAILQRTRAQDRPYRIERALIYKVHQQVAETFRKGRVILAGDSAHLNNPMGGQGLNAGIHDAFNLAQKFVDIWHGGDVAMLDLYDRQRRITNMEYIQKVSIENKKRNEEPDLAIRAAAFDAMEGMLANETTRFAFINRFCMGESLDFADTIT